MKTAAAVAVWVLAVGAGLGTGLLAHRAAGTPTPAGTATPPATPVPPSPPTTSPSPTPVDHLLRPERYAAAGLGGPLSLRTGGRPEPGRCIRAETAADLGRLPVESAEVTGEGRASQVVLDAGTPERAQQVGTAYYQDAVECRGDEGLRVLSRGSHEVDGGSATYFALAPRGRSAATAYQLVVRNRQRVCSLWIETPRPLDRASLDTLATDVATRMG